MHHLDTIRLKIALTVALTWLLPAVSFPIFLDLYPLPDYLSSRFNVTAGMALYVFSMLAVSLFLIDRQVVNLDQKFNDAAIEASSVRRALVRLLLVCGIVTFCYLCGGAVVAVVSSDTPISALGLPDYLTIALVGALIFFYITIPGYIYSFSLLGQYYGSTLSDLRFSSSRIRMLMAGPGVVLITVSSFTAYFFLVAQQPTEPLIFLGLLLFSYALVVSLLAHQSYQSALRPLADYLATDSIDADINILSPRSADETGLAVQALRQTLSELKKSEERFRQFAEATSDYFFEMDKDLKFSYLSERYEEITGTPAEKVLGLSAPSMGAVYDVENFSEHSTDLERYQPYRNFMFGVTLLDGREMNLSVSAVPHFSADGEFLGYRGAGTDVTELVETQKTLEEHTKLLVHSQKMDALGQLTGGIAHDFNNLLTVIIGNVELLQFEDDVQASNGYAEQAMNAAQKGASLVKRLLAYSRMQPLAPETVDLKQLFVAMLDLIDRSLTENIKVQFNPVDMPVCAYVDPQQLENVILNLAINARDAMPEGGTLQIRLSTVDIGNDMELQDGQYCLIEMQDDGVGIDEETLPLVFEPFFTTKDIGKGSGLGLSTVYGMIKQSHGVVRIESTLGKGTLVSLLLPFNADQPKNMSNHGQVQSTPMAADGEHILLVEDDGLVRELISRQLDDLGYQVTAVGDAETALSVFSNAPNVDLVLTDVVLSGAIDGLDMSKQLQELSPGLPILFLTGYSDRFEQIDAERLIPKPFKLRELAIKLRKVLQ